MDTLYLNYIMSMTGIFNNGSTCTENKAYLSIHNVLYMSKIIHYIISQESNFCNYFM